MKSRLTAAFFIVLSAALVLGLTTAFAIGESTGTVSACATASTPAHTVAVDGGDVHTIPGDTATQCVTSTYTIPTVTSTVAGPTTTVTSTVTSTVSGPTAKSLASFGAVGDGTTDDTAALKAAFTSGGDVYSPAGKTYLVSSQLTLVHGADFGGSTVKGAGIWSTGTDARLSNVTVTGASIGIRADDASKLVCTACNVDHNSYGFYVAGRALAGTSISGTATLNTIGLEIHSPNGGTVSSFKAIDNNKFGVILYDTAGWHFGQIESSRTGCTAKNQAGTGVELWQNSHDNTFDKLTLTQNPGYALALNHASSSNTFTEITADNTNSCVDGDPGISFVDGSSSNTIGKATIINHTVGLRFGENDSGTDRPVNDNTVTTYIGSSLAYGAIRFEDGNRNRVGSATLTDIKAVWQPWVRAAIEFSPNGFVTTGNSVGSVTHSGLWPTYGIHFGPQASGNSAPASAGPVLDESGGKNTVG